MESNIFDINQKESMRKTLRHIFFMVITVSLLASCRKEIEKYDRPEWLVGKLYSQVMASEDLDSFAICIKEAGFDSIINVSGSFTVFAPTNQAFHEYFQRNSEYNKISDIPFKELEKIVKYHIVQNSWSTTQLISLNSDGWVDPDDPDDKSWGFKRQTVLKEDNRKYWVNTDRGKYTFVDSLNANFYRIVNTASRKYVPFFWDRFLNISEISGDDYDFYFPSGYSQGRIHFAGSRVISSEIYAENGILYKIDEVVEPLKTAEQILEQDYSGYSYSDFLKMIYSYAQLSPNMQETMNMPGFEGGSSVDTIFNMTFPDLTFNIRSEMSDPLSSNNSISLHRGLIAPTNQALDDLFSQEITGPGRYSNNDAVPPEILSLIVNSHMRTSPIYFKDLTQGFKNGEDDIVMIDPSDVVQANFASNSTFIGVNKAIIPRAFKSIAGPVYLNPNYSIYRSAIEISGVLPALKRKNQDYAFFVVPDDILNNDSSLIYEVDNPNQINLESLDRNNIEMVRRNRLDLVNLLFNHICTSSPTGNGRKEFIQNLAGNYVVFDWENGIVTGGTESTYGYQGDSLINITANLLDEPADNGEIYKLNGFLSFASGDMYSILRKYPEFSELLDKANLFDKTYYNVKFINPGETYTVFMPSNTALSNFDASELTDEELIQFIKNHFVRGNIIFTDGKKPDGEYPILSSDGNNSYNKVILKPGIDIIDIMNPDGSLYYRINEKGSSTNVIITEGTEGAAASAFATRGVLHVIDTVLIK